MTSRNWLILEQLDALMDPLALDAGAIPDRDRLVFFERQLAVVPLVQNHVSRAFTVYRKVALIVP